MTTFLMTLECSVLFLQNWQVCSVLRYLPNFLTYTQSEVCAVRSVGVGLGSSFSEQHWGQRPVPIPLQIQRQHVEKDMGTHPIFLVNRDGTDVEIALDITEGAFHLSQTLIGCDGGSDRLSGEIGPDDIDAV